MGNYLTSSSISDLWSGRKEQTPVRLMMMGLDAAGKTTILYRLKLGEVVTTIPTIGFNVETIQTASETLVAWDAGGRVKIRPLLRHYYKGTDGIVFVVDANDTYRMEQVKDEIHRTLSEDELSQAPLLILCNKQDLPNAISPEQVTKRLGIDEDTISRPFLAIGCVGSKGDGLHEGMDWLLTEARAAKESRAREAAAASSENSETKDDDANLKLGQSLHHKLGFFPSAPNSNPVLKNFQPIQRGTQCPFAKAAKLWGVPAGNDSLTAEALTEFVRRSNDGEALDGFCIQLPDDAAQVTTPTAFGKYVHDCLYTLSALDPSGERTMHVNYIGARGWRFRFDKADFFVTTFAPCYPSSSSRYTFGSGHAFLLLQPELSFLRHDLPDDTPVTQHDPPVTIRDKTRIAFRDAGRPYHIPATTKYPAAEHIVKPLHDDADDDAWGLSGGGKESTKLYRV